jgi:hypothetical protein
MKKVIPFILLPFFAIARIQGVAYNTTNETFSPPEADIKIKSPVRLSDATVPSERWVTLDSADTMKLYSKSYSTNWIFRIVGLQNVTDTNSTNVVVSAPFTNEFSGAELLIASPSLVTDPSDVASNNVGDVMFQVRYDDSTWATNGMSIKMTHTNGNYQVMYGVGSVLTNASVYGSYTNFYGTNSVILSAGYVGTQIVTTNTSTFYSYPKTMQYIGSTTNSSGFVTNMVIQTGIMTNSFNFYAP